LMRCRETLFPGAALPSLTGADTTSDDRPVDRLVRLLATTDRTTIPSAEVQVLTGIRAGDLSAALDRPDVAPFAASYGWSLMSQKALGGKGKAKVLVKPCHDDQPMAA
jgi:hypothetical protein